MADNAPKKTGLNRNIDIVEKKVGVLQTKKSILEKQKKIANLQNQIGNKRSEISNKRKELSEKQKELSNAQGPGTMIFIGIVILILALIVSSFVAGLLTTQKSDEQ